jgi:hypothetical protein
MALLHRATVVPSKLVSRNDGAGGARHAVLGMRWTSDALGDPVYRSELAHAILTPS